MKYSMKYKKAFPRKKKILHIASVILGVSLAAGGIAFVKEHKEDRERKIILARKHASADETGNDDKSPWCQYQHHMGIYERYIKRPLDCTLATGALIVFSPILLGTALLVRIKLGSPVLFTQERPGRIDPATGKEKIFKLYKFRTMTDARDANGELLPDEERLTEFGKWLRSTSLDELPELINIIKGDMSVVAPRPLLVQYLPLYNEHQARRHEVRPGITGYAQVHGRNSVSWEEKFDMDVWYVDHISFLTDVKIVLETVKTVLCREGISSESSATMEYFTGDRS